MFQQPRRALSTFFRTPDGVAVFFAALFFGGLFGCESGVRFGLSEQTQSFSQSIAYNNKVDILFVVDNSSSMSDHQVELARNIPDMINRLNSLKMDYHIAVTTTTMGSDLNRFPMSRQILGTPKYLSNSNIQSLTNRLLAGDTGSDLERGLESIEYVLSSSYLDLNAPGFLRRDALLSIIIIGDEDDQSVGNISRYETFLNTIKPPFKEGGQAWIVNLIGVLRLSSSCDSLGIQVSAAVRYMALVDKSGGVKESICERNLVPAVANIKARITEILTAFRMASEPIEQTIQVLVNGVVVPKDSTDGWSYEVQNNTNGKSSYFIKFHGRSIPAADAQIKVNYDPRSAG